MGERRQVESAWDMIRDFAELAIPESCPGCGSPGKLCLQCQQELRTVPQQITPRVAVAAPTWACGPYGGVRQALVLAAKEHRDVIARETIGSVIGASLAHLIAHGQLAHPAVQPLLLVPAPTRRSASRRRGGDPITQVCEYAASYLKRSGGILHGGRRTDKNDQIFVSPVLRTREEAKDSAGLSARTRRQNLSGKIVPEVKELSRSAGDNAGRSQIVLVDDVITTGATVAESVLVLASMGLRTSLVLSFTQA